MNRDTTSRSNLDRNFDQDIEAFVPSHKRYATRVEGNERNNMNDKDASLTRSRSVRPPVRPIELDVVEADNASVGRSIVRSAKDAEGYVSLKCQWHKICAEYCRSGSPPADITFTTCCDQQELAS